MLGSRVVRTASGDIAVFRTADDEGLRSTTAVRTAGGPLSQGIVHNKRVTCPLHNFVIELESGCGGRAGRGCTRAHPTKVEKQHRLALHSAAAAAARRVRVIARASEDKLSRIAASAAASSREQDAVGRGHRPGRSAASRQFRAAVRERLGAGREPSASKDALLAPVDQRQETAWDAALDHVMRRLLAE